MVSFVKQDKLHCEPCPVCKNCQGTIYLCENGHLSYNFTEKPTCSNPPKGYFTKHNTFEKCRKPCGENEYEAARCGFCSNRICNCKPGFYHDSLKDCTKKCSLCLSTDDSYRIKECDNVLNPNMVMILSNLFCTIIYCLISLCYILTCCVYKQFFSIKSFAHLFSGKIVPKHSTYSFNNDIILNTYFLKRCREPSRSGAAHKTTAYIDTLKPTMTTIDFTTLHPKPFNEIRPQSSQESNVYEKAIIPSSVLIGLLFIFYIIYKKCSKLCCMISKQILNVIWGYIEVWESRLNFWLEAKFFDTLYHCQPLWLLIL